MELTALGLFFLSEHPAPVLLVGVFVKMTEKKGKPICCNAQIEWYKKSWIPWPDLTLGLYRGLIIKRNNWYVVFTRRGSMNRRPLSEHKMTNKV